MPSLRLTAPGHPPTVYNLYKKITSIGAGPDNDVVLPDPLVADSYASMRLEVASAYTLIFFVMIVPLLVAMQILADEGRNR